MPSRCRAALIAVAALIGSLGLAHAQADNERQIMLLGGSPRAKNFNFFGFGGSDATRTRVSYSGKERPGTIVVNTAERRLYFVQEDGNALRYGIGVGRVGFQWKGTHKVSAKKEWPAWTPPPQMRARRAACRATWPAAKTIRSARAPCISAARSIASTARTIRIRSARRCHRAASA